MSHPTHPVISLSRCAKFLPAPSSYLRQVCQFTRAFPALSTLCATPPPDSPSLLLRPFCVPLRQVLMSVFPCLYPGLQTPWPLRVATHPKTRPVFHYVALPPTPRLIQSFTTSRPSHVDPLDPTLVRYPKMTFIQSSIPSSSRVR